jgi:hypothetical protein
LLVSAGGTLTHGGIAYNKDGEFVKLRMLQVQYHDIKPGAGLDVWCGMSYQTVLSPPDLKTGDVIWPYAAVKPRHKAHEYPSVQGLQRRRSRHRFARRGVRRLRHRHG